MGHLSVNAIIPLLHLLSLCITSKRNIKEVTVVVRQRDDSLHITNAVVIVVITDMLFT